MCLMVHQNYLSAEITLNLKDNGKPLFFRLRLLPLTMKDKVEKKTDNLDKNRILETVEFYEWGAPIVSIIKKDLRVRIYCNFKITLNCLLIGTVWRELRMFFQNFKGDRNHKIAAPDTNK